MSQNSSDLRVRRTQKLLREALIALIEERSFDAITVGEIAERAMVSRAAFYRHYQDKYDLVEKIFEEMITTVTHEIDPLRRSVIDRLGSHPPADPWGELFQKVPEGQATPEPWVKMFDHFAQYERLYRALLGKKGSTWFVTRMRTFIAEMLRTRVQALVGAISNLHVAEKHIFASGFLPNLVSAQLIEAVVWWLEQERPYSPRQIATYTHHLMRATLREAGTWEE
ncbi:MAG: TetR family transcriptional regulator [Ktedonobacteraceae bacterium]|nr:TetR family transcriptional regulator [Ktedonobacteraceae bacterium]MBO0793455.1 TetR family transcriptional regulator [Ktedonobacteraceae bacterium]